MNNVKKNVQNTKRDPRIKCKECSSTNLKKERDSIYLCLDCYEISIIMICLNCNSLLDRALINKDGCFCDLKCNNQYYTNRKMTHFIKK